MLLTIDIGNTNISCGVFSATRRGGFAKNYGERGSRLLNRFNIPTGSYSIKRLKKRLAGIDIDDGIICSVVPRMTPVFKRDLVKLLKKKPLVVGENIKVPIRNLYRNPKQVGQDRLVNAYAGIVFYGAPLIAVDFGTAVTFDAISKKQEYLGGLIVPGLDMALAALVQHTALLPKIKLKRPREFIGTDTVNSMLSGAVYGFAALTDNLIERLKKEVGRQARVIGTGGNIGLIRAYCKGIDRVDRDLTLKGLNLIYNKKFS